VLAMDIGSSSARSALFDEAGRVLTKTLASREYAVRYTADRGAELSPTVLLRAAKLCLQKTLRARDSTRSFREIPIAAVAGSAFWHSLLGLDRKGRPLTPVFTWADSRCASDAAQLRGQFDERKIHAQTGCMLRASFWPAKLRWLRRTNSRLFREVVRWVSPAEWIFQQLFGATGSSYSMASATGLYDLRAKLWHVDLCEACEVDGNELGAPVDVATVNGTQSRKLKDTKIFTAIGDGAAGNLGSGAEAHGAIAINVGTSAAVRMTESTGNVAIPIPLGLFRYAIDRDRTVMGGAVSNAGNLRRWCLRELRLGESEAQMNKALSRRAAANDPLTVLPFWVGERAPSWPENLRGTIVGLDQTTTAAQLFRATICATFYRLAEILNRVEDAAGPAEKIIVSGGILHSAASVRLLADAFGRDISVSSQAEASLRGAAVYVLEKLGHRPDSLPKPTVVRHNRNLAKKHRTRREQQVSLEKTLAIETRS
jgi:gluconokinase